MITALLRRLSIHHKLVALSMLVSAAALLIASAAFVTLDYFQFREDLRRELSVQARMVLENSTAAMSFRDQAAARETMETLAPNAHIFLACLYAPGGALFAEYRTAADHCPTSAPASGYAFGPDRLELTEGTDVAGRPGGWVHLRSDLGALTDRLQLIGVAASVVLIAVMAIAFTLSASLQRVISTPLTDLARTAREVSARDDYSLRASKTTHDELGQLVDAFNDMLEQIQKSRDERTSLFQREREASRVKDEFLMTLSHELRTPLNAILGWARMLTAGVIPPDAAQRAIQKIERNAQAQARLVEDLLEVSRFTTGKFRLEKQPMDLVAVINGAIEATRPAAVARGVRIDKVFDAPALPTVGDPDRLQQVAWNLLSNAVKFSANGSAVSVSLRREDAVDILEVRDTGIGIDPAFLPHVFDPFRQGDASSTRAHGGLGLGLSIVRRITELHGGTVSADSAGHGHGATFVIRLPVVAIEAAEASADAARAEPIAEGDLAGVSVLIVDDDEDSREMLMTLLTASGASVRTAASAAEAIAHARDRAPDVLISDIAMPHEDGFALMRGLEALLGPAMPRVCIALTAQAGDAFQARALAAGFERYVAKPCDPAALVALVRGLVRTSPA